MTSFSRLIQSALLHSLFYCFRLMPPSMASNSGGALGRLIGPRLGASRKALDNLRRALPDRTESEYKEIVTAMWDNLGRVFAEYPHLAAIGKNNVDIVNVDLLDKLGLDEKPCIFYAAHLANWEVPSAAFLARKDINLGVVYRAPNNPSADRLLDRTRSLNGRIATIPKSRTGTRQLVQALKDGMHVGILIDQKYNEGIPVPFFGRPAMTSPAFVQLAQKFNCPLVPVQCERVNKTGFRITLFEPVELYSADGSPRPAEDVIAEAHKDLEKWISEKPGQWLWLHRRWSSKAVQEIEERALSEQTG